MAIKIIKDGTTEFEATCPRCGCEFSYELEDIIVDSLLCPCCKEKIYHKKITNYDTTTIPKTVSNPKDTAIPYDDLVYRQPKLRDWVTRTDNQSACEGCPNNVKYLKEPYVGDSICEQCIKNPNKTACISKLGASNED